MRTFIVAICVFLVLISGIVTYSFYIEAFEDKLLKTTEEISNYAKKENWDETYSQYKNLYKNWEKNEKILAMFNDHGELDDIKLSLSDLKKSIEHKNKEHTQKATEDIKILVKRLRKNESFTIENILKLSQNQKYKHNML